MSDTIGELVDACRSGEKPDYDDLRHLVCCLDSLLTFASTDLSRAIDKPKFYTPMVLYTQQFERIKRALDKEPLQWLGDSNNPDIPEVQERRELAKKIFSKASPTTGPTP